MDTRFFYSVGFILLDDIVFPDGRTKMAVLGGGSTHAAMGMRIWDHAVGLVASIGQDFPESLREDLAQTFDLRGVQEKKIATTRSWQLYEDDGTRTEVFRTDINEMWAAVPHPEVLPLAFTNARGVHLYCQAPNPLENWIQHLRCNGCDLLLWEPLARYCLPENRQEIQQLMQRVDVVSLGLPEAQQLTELEKPMPIVMQLIADGANAVALRMGAQGSLVAGARGEIYTIPPFPVKTIADVTGAGNAYCGGFIVGLEKSDDLFQAGLYGSVSASLVLENSSALLSLEGLQTKAERRLDHYKA